jgi:cyclase
MGVGEVLLTSIDQEGTGKGFDYSLAQKAIEVTNVPFVISGGGGALEHIKKVAQIGVSGLTLSAMVHYDAVQNFEETTDNIADFKIIGERKIVKNFQTTNIFEIKEYLNQNNIRCRL